MKTKVHTAKVSIPLYRHVPTETGTGTVARPDGRRTGTVVLTIDLEALTQTLGAKALRNKTKKVSKLADGLIEATVTHHEREEA